MSPETQEHLRKQAIRWRKQGMSYVAIAAQLEVRRNTVSNGWQAYQAEGVRGIPSQTRGRKPGEQRTLSPRQEQQSQALLSDQTPEQYKLSLRSRRGSTPSAAGSRRGSTACIHAGVHPCRGELCAVDSPGVSGVAPAAFAPDYATPDGGRDAQALGFHPS